LYLFSDLEDKKVRCPLDTSPPPPSAASKTALIVACLLPLLLAGRDSTGAAISPGGGLEIVTGPYLQVPENRAGTMAILWETSFPSRGTLVIGEKDQPPQTIASTDSGTRHKVVLEGLDPSATYRYHVESGNRFSRTYAFRPFPAEATSYAFAVYGDSRYNDAAHQAVISQMTAYQPDFVLHTGDLVTQGNVMDQWDIFFVVVRSLAARVPFFPTIGNHDYWKGGTKIFKTLFMPPKNSPSPVLDYFVDTGNARFVVLDNRRVGKASQKTWLEETLKDARDVKKLPHIFVSIHQGIQSSGPHGPDDDLDKQGYLELFKAYGVAIVFAGHDHMYERGVRNGIRYIVTAGGGAPLYDKVKPVKDTQLRATERHFVAFTVEQDKVAFKVVRPDGTLIETCTLIKKGYDCTP
jgi:predicted phosphodiesterase